MSLKKFFNATGPGTSNKSSGPGNSNKFDAPMPDVDKAKEAKLIKEWKLLSISLNEHLKHCLYRLEKLKLIENIDNPKLKDFIEETQINIYDLKVLIIKVEIDIEYLETN